MHGLLSFLQREEEKERFPYGVSPDMGLPNFLSCALGSKKPKEWTLGVPCTWPAIRLSSCLSRISGVLRHTRETHLFVPLNLRSPRANCALRPEGGSSQPLPLPLPRPCAPSYRCLGKKDLPYLGHAAP